jgi:hypothetical protein
MTAGYSSPWPRYDAFKDEASALTRAGAEFLEIAA